MYTKVIAIIAIVACAQAVEESHATSYSSINKFIQPAAKVATIAQYAPVAHVAHIAPVAHVSHISHVAPIAHVSHVAPLAHVSHVAPITHVSHVAPIAHVSHVAPIAHVSHVAPIAHVSHVAPIAHVSHVSPIAHVAPVIHKEEIYADAHPHYAFDYGVKDTHTGDIKNQHEERDGDVVKGVYSLVQPDGVTRTVHYSGDHKSGFNAQVEYSGHADHPEVKNVVAAKIVSPVYEYHH